MHANLVVACGFLSVVIEPMSGFITIAASFSALVLSLNENDRNTVSTSQCKEDYVAVTGVYGMVYSNGDPFTLRVNETISIKGQVTRVDCIDL